MTTQYLDNDYKISQHPIVNKYTEKFKYARRGEDFKRVRERGNGF